MTEYLTGVDVCVVSYHTPRLLGEFVDSYAAVARRDSQLFIRVNDPDRQDELTLSGRVDVIDGAVNLGDNIGYARSVNFLTAQGSHDVVAIFNADCRLTDDLWDCVEFLQENPDYGIVGPMLLNRRGRMTCGGGVGGVPPNPKFRAWMRCPEPKHRVLMDSLTVSGAAFFVRRDVWDELTACPEYRRFLEDRGERVEGAFLPTEHWWEETFCAVHSRAHGYKVGYLGTAQMFHDHGQSGPPPGGTRSVRDRSKRFFLEACKEVHNMEHEN